MATTTVYQIPEWFITKTLDKMRYCGITDTFTEAQIIKQTDKAYYVLFKYEIWVPKSVVTEAGQREVVQRTEVRGIHSANFKGYTVTGGPRSVSYLELDKAVAYMRTLLARHYYFYSIRHKDGEYIFTFREQYRHRQFRWAMEKVANVRKGVFLCELSGCLAQAYLPYLYRDFYHDNRPADVKRGWIK